MASTDGQVVCSQDTQRGLGRVSPAATVLPAEEAVSCSLTLDVHDPAAGRARGRVCGGRHVVSERGGGDPGAVAWHRDHARPQARTNRRARTPAHGQRRMLGDAATSSPAPARRRGAPHRGSTSGSKPPRSAICAATTGSIKGTQGSMRRDASRPRRAHRGPCDGSRRRTRGEGRLLRRTFLIAFVLMSGGLLSSSAVELVFRYRESVEGLRAVQQEMARTAAVQVQQFLTEIHQRLQAATHTPETLTAGLTEAYRFALRTLLHMAPAITHAAVLDTTGRERLKVSREQMILPADLADRAGDPAFVQARAGTTFFGPVYFVRQSEPYMRMAVPIERVAGEVIGVLMAEVNLTYIWEVMSRITVGQTGYAYVVSPQGDLIAHPDLSLVLQHQRLTHLRQVQAALAGVPSPSTQTNLQGERVLTTWAAIPLVGWAVLVERLAREAYAPLYRSLLRTAVLFLLGLGMAGLVRVLIHRRVVRPVEVLRQGAERIGAGALQYRIDVQTGDEIGRAHV